MRCVFFGDENPDFGDKNRQKMTIDEDRALFFPGKTSILFCGQSFTQIGILKKMLSWCQGWVSFTCSPDCSRL